MCRRAHPKGELALRLGGLDAAIRALESSMGPTWKDTIVAVVTEFGRTGRANGTHGMDHGTATVALLVGGAVKGGRVFADWPGLRDAALYEGRTLRAERHLHPSTDAPPRPRKLGLWRKQAFSRTPSRADAANCATNGQ
jgi:uncharacterized protein (DUF1501 family)